jgi:hypothetical protein
MPLFVPVPEDYRALGKARTTDYGRPAWLQSAGASVMATGVVQLAWLPDQICRGCPLPTVHLEWLGFCADGSGLLLWKAFVSGPDKDPSKSQRLTRASAWRRSALACPAIRPIRAYLTSSVRCLWPPLRRYGRGYPLPAQALRDRGHTS